MNSAALAAKLLALADDEYILGHRDAEWTGHAPILEEDIAFANIAQDEIGHAVLWYNALKDLNGDDPDRLVFFRESSGWRNAQFVELPKGDWAFTMVRQYLFDAAELVRLAETVNSAHRAVAEVSEKIRPEEMYHYRHTSNWVKRLGLGTEESHRRMQAALDSLWPRALQLFAPLPNEDELIAAGIFPAPDKLRAAWEGATRSWLTDSGLTIPTITASAADREQHTEHLAALLAEMQEVARLEPPDVKW
ncbi:MAG: phenylacetate-CoA oxygenase subunit PaaC [Chloroflexi bacterium]|nr:phenylacetate-CoA oxygenase subunit PaaC [Chloroflexota bacterium]